MFPGAGKKEWRKSLILPRDLLKDLDGESALWSESYFGEDPADELKKVEDKVERGEMVVDFYDILGEVQKNKPAA